MKKRTSILLLLALMIMASCTKPAGYGDISVQIGYSINGKPLITDSLCYVNEAENEFMITEIQWFFSKMELQNEQGEWIALEPRIFYIDTNIPESQTLNITSIPLATYKALRFVFGLNETDNRSGLFTDPPESEMFWPDVLGGGYHYMKLNGRYINNTNQLAPLAIHLGIGQNAACTEFYQNYFIVELPVQLTVTESTDNQLDLTMVIDNWFRSPNLIDFNEFGSGIMQNQTAQNLLKANGQDVFIIGKQAETTMNKEEALVEKFKAIMQKAAPQPHFWNLQNIKERVAEIKTKEAKI